MSSTDNVKPKSTPPPRSTLKAEKPPISPKPADLQTKYEAPPAAQANNVDPTNSEMQKPSSLVNERIKCFGGKASSWQIQSVIDQSRSK